MLHLTRRLCPLAVRGAKTLPTLSLQHPRWQSTQSTTDTTSPITAGRLIYLGQLARAARNLKRFSVCSLSLSVVAVPFLYLVDSQVSVEFRSALASAILITSVSSTALIQYSMAPYVTRISLPDSSNDDASTTTAVDISGDTRLELEKFNFFGQSRTSIVRAGDLVPARHMLSAWRSPTGEYFNVQTDTVQTEEMLQLVQLVQAKDVQ